MSLFNLKWFPAAALRLETSSETANFNAASGNLYLISPAGATLNVQLPAPSASAHIVLKEMSGDESKTINIVRNAAENIDGVAANSTIESAYESVTLISDGTDWYKI